MLLAVDDIQTPLETQDYTTPDLPKALDFYPEWLVKASLRGQEIRDFGGSLPQVYYALAKANARPGRTRSGYFNRFMEHFGWRTLEEYCDEYRTSLP